MRLRRGLSLIYSALTSTALTLAFLISSRAAAAPNPFGGFVKGYTMTAAQILGVPADATYDQYRVAYRTNIGKYFEGQSGKSAADDQRTLAMNLAWDHVKKIEIARKQALMEDEARKNEPREHDIFTRAQEWAQSNPDDLVARAAESYRQRRMSRSVELMEVLSANFRLGDTDPIIDVFERRFKNDFLDIIRAFGTNIYMGPATEVLLEAVIEHIAMRYPKHADDLIDTLGKYVDEQYEIVARELLTSKDAPEKIKHLNRLKTILDRGRVDYGRKKKRPAISCEKNTY